MSRYNQETELFDGGMAGAPAAQDNLRAARSRGGAPHEVSGGTSRGGPRGRVPLSAARDRAPDRRSAYQDTVSSQEDDPDMDFDGELEDEISPHRPSNHRQRRPSPADSGARDHRHGNPTPHSRPSECGRRAPGDLEDDDEQQPLTDRDIRRSVHNTFEGEASDLDDDHPSKRVRDEYDHQPSTRRGTRRPVHEAFEEEESDLDNDRLSKRVRDHDLPLTRRDTRRPIHNTFEEEESLFEPNMPQRRGKIQETMPMPTIQPESSGDFDTHAPPVGVLSASHRLKKDLDLVAGSPAALLVGQRKNQVELDPENHMIKDMRQRLHLPWGEIKDRMNAHRAKQGKPQSFTDAAVYGRFVRNGKRIAEASGEDFNPSDYMHFTPAVKAKAATLIGKPAAADPTPSTKSTTTPTATYKWPEERKILLVECVRHVNEEFWQLVADKMEEFCQEPFDPAILQKQFLTI